MSIPKHIPKKQTKKYIDELRRQGKMRVFIVSIDEYTRFGSGEVSLELYEATSVRDLLEQLERWNGSMKEFIMSNGDGQDFLTISELVIKKKGKKDCGCVRTLDLKSVKVSEEE